MLKSVVFADPYGKYNILEDIATNAISQLLPTTLRTFKKR